MDNFLGIVLQVEDLLCFASVFLQVAVWEKLCGSDEIGDYVFRKAIKEHDTWQ
jgi:hypothetical protein